MKKTCIFMTVILIFTFCLSACNDARTESVASQTSEDSQESQQEELKTDKPVIDFANLAVAQADGIEEASVAFGVDMLRLSKKDGENSMISPLSILLALGMTANGADGETLEQMQKVLCGGKSIEEFNEYYEALVKRITNPKKGTVSVANSIWYRDEKDRLTMKEDFIKLVEDVYSSEINPADFNNPETVDLINNWVKDKTDGCIEKIIKEIDLDAVIYLINALYFEMKWQFQYSEAQVNEGVFHTVNGDKNVTFMFSEENSYIKDDKAEGFSKPYEGGKFSFVALLPDEGITAEEYLNELNGEKLLNLLKNRQKKLGKAKMPKFKAEFDASLVKPLKKLGMTNAFDEGIADFKKMAVSTMGNIFINDVKHKTFIEVNETGTKAAAVTAVEMANSCVPSYEFEITLDCPFIYMIIDEETSLPLFIGIFNTPNE